MYNLCRGVWIVIGYFLFKKQTFDVLLKVIGFKIYFINRVLINVLELSVNEIITIEWGLPKKVFCPFN